MTAQQVIDYIFGTFAPTLWDRLYDIISAPVTYPNMVWILFPMLVTLLLMTFYFGRYRKEELGWNTAVGNALVLLFVSIDLLQKVYPLDNPIQALLIFIRTLFSQGFTGEGILPGIVAGGILVYAIMLLTADFYHWLPKKVAFFVSSGLPINVLAYFGIIFVYSRTSKETAPLILDWYTLLAFFLLFIALYIVLRFLQTIEPHKDDAEVLEDAPAPKRHKKGVGAPKILDEQEFAPPPGSLADEAPSPDIFEDDDDLPVAGDVEYDQDVEENV